MKSVSGHPVESAAHRHKLACEKANDLLAEWGTLSRKLRNARREEQELHAEHAASKVRLRKIEAEEATAWARRDAATRDVMSAYARLLDEYSKHGEPYGVTGAISALHDKEGA